MLKFTCKNLLITITSKFTTYKFITGLSKVLICGGYYPHTDTCEVIDLESSTSTCKNPPNVPARVYGDIGGFSFHENPIVCGGVQIYEISNKCYSLQNNQWVSTEAMNSVRYRAAAAQLEDGKLLVTGGTNGSVIYNSAEMLTEEGWESNVPTLPVTITAWSPLTHQL